MHPFWWLAPPPSPRWGDFILRYALSEGIALQSFILPPEQGEVRRSRIGGAAQRLITRMPIKLYDTDSQSRNASCVPFRGRGPRSGEGVDGGKNDYDTLILCLIVLRSGGRRLAVRTAMEHPIGTLPRTPFPASRDFP